MLTLFIIGMTCLMAVQGEPEAEADPQFFYPNTYPVYNNYYHPGFYPVVRTPLVQKASVVQKTAEVKAEKPVVFTQYPTAFYPTQSFYQPFLRYAPVVYYPTTYPGFLQQAKPAPVTEEDTVDDAEVIDTRDALAMTQDTMTHKPLRPIIPLFDYVRNANSQVTFLRPDQAPEPENQEAEENSHLVQFRSLPYTQAHLNRIPVAK